MKTIILCGGIGYRLKEETEFKPKPMVSLGGKPILWHIMKMYAHYGYNDFIIALGYKGDYIKDFFINQKYFTHDFTLETKTGRMKVHRDSTLRKTNDNFKITFVDTGLNTLPGERILRVKDYIPHGDNEFMVTYGDAVSTIQIDKLVNFHRQQKTIGTITGVHPRSKWGLVRVDKSSVVSEFVEKPVLDDWVNGGFMVFNKEMFTFLKEGEMEHEGLKRLINKKQLSLFAHDGFWYAVDTYSDLESLNKHWEQNPEWKIWKD